MKGPLTVGSLFSGIGGIDRGLEMAGMKVIWQCENDKYARQVLGKHWQMIPIYYDIRTMDGHVRRPDVLCGGFPCQDISVAGNGKGLAGERSGLFYEIVRLTKEIRPTFVFLENVPAIRTRQTLRLRKIKKDVKALIGVKNH
jgi:DNA (cytosine-5)-methyltransferase 1